MTSKPIEFDLVPVGTPTKNGRVHLEVAVTEAVRVFNERPTKFAVLATDTPAPLHISLEHVAATISELFIEDGMLKGRLERILTTPMGGIFQELVNQEVPYHMSLIGHGYGTIKVDENGKLFEEIHDLTILYINISDRKRPYDE